MSIFHRTEESAQVMKIHVGESDCNSDSGGNWAKLTQLLPKRSRPSTEQIPLRFVTSGIPYSSPYAVQPQLPRRNEFLKKGSTWRPSVTTTTKTR